MARDLERVTVSTYTNKKGAERVAVQFARSLALKVATGNLAARDKIIDAVIERIEAQERRTDDE